MNTGGPKTILLVEDEAIIALAQARTVRGFGYKVFTAASGEKAVELAAGDADISLVLMDIDLGPGLDGPDAASRILEARAVPIVFLTAHSEREMVEKVRGITRYGYVIKDSGDFVLQSSIEMAFELFEAHEKTREREDALLKSQALLNELGRLAKVGGWEYEIAKDEMYWTDETYNIYEVDRGIFVPSLEKAMAFYTPEARRKIEQARDRIMEMGEPWDEEVEIVTAKGKRRWVRIIGKAEIENGRIVKRLGATQDISKRKQEEAALMQNQIFLNEMGKMAKVGGWEYDVGDATSRWTEEQYRLFEVEPSFIPTVEKATQFYAPESRIKLIEARRRLMETGEPYDLESEIITDKGNRRWIRNTGKAKYAGGTIVGRMGITQDITARKSKEDAIRALIAEKELRIREVHHRVKNNIGIMMSFLALQAKTMKDAASAQALTDAQNRLRSMGALYDRLYRSEDLEEMPLPEYLPPLIEELVKVFPAAANVRIETKVGDFALGVKELSALGIIVNELITNIMKHAFVGKAEGLISVSAARQADRVTIEIADDGVGMPESVDLENSGGFGLMLVSTLVRQLKGSIRIERGKGTAIVLSFEARAG